MKITNIVQVHLLISLFGIYSFLNASIAFSDATTALKFGTGGKFLIKSTERMSKIIGTLEMANSGISLAGSTSKLFCNNATLGIGTAQSLVFTGTYDPSYTYSLIFNGINSELRSYQQGTIYERLTACGSGAVVGGLCMFGTPNAIKLSTQQTNLNVELLTELTSNIVMNGGTLSLLNDLILSDNVLLTGSGNVVFNGFNLVTGQKDLIWTSTLLLTGAKNVVFGSNSSIKGQWRFNNSSSNSGHICGNNYTLDLTSGGKLFVAGGSTLELSNIKIKGFGSGKIIFGDANSKIILNNATILLDMSRSFTGAHFLINGPCTFVTGSNILYLSSASSFSVDGAAVVYDTLGYNDNNNIRFSSLNANVTYLNGGAIKKNKLLWVGDYTLPGPVGGSALILDQEFYVSSLRKMNIIDNASINGAGFYIQFARHPSTSIFNVNAEKSVQFSNILLKDFPAQSNTLGSSAQLIFGDGCNVELGENAILTTTWYFSGQSVMNGNGKTLKFGSGGSIVIKPGAGVLFDNITIKGIGTSSCFPPIIFAWYGNPSVGYSIGAGRYDVTNTLNKMILQQGGVLSVSGSYNTIFGGDPSLNNVKTLNIIFANGSSLVYQENTSFSLTASQLSLLGKFFTIRFMDNTATLSLGNVTWIQDKEFTMTNGRFDVLGRWDIVGSTTFCYAGTKTCTITQFGTMHVDNGMTFSYAPRVNARDLIWMENNAAAIQLTNATLASTTTGMRLTQGTLILDGTCTITNYNPATGVQATSDSQAVAFGKGKALKNELTVILYPSSSLNIAAGKLYYDNAS